MTDNLSWERESKHTEQRPGRLYRPQRPSTLNTLDSVSTEDSPQKYHDRFTCILSPPWLKRATHKGAAKDTWPLSGRATLATRRKLVNFDPICGRPADCASEGGLTLGLKFWMLAVAEIFHNVGKGA